MKKKLRLAFEELEAEIEVLNRKQQREFKGGDIGQVVGGNGSANDPIVIYAPIYYGNDLSAGTISGIQSAAHNITSSGSVFNNGKYYRFMVTAIGLATSNEARNQAGALNVNAGSDYAGFVGEATLGNSAGGYGLTLGQAGSTTIMVDPTNISLSSTTTSFVISHEIGHLFGVGHSTSWNSAMSEDANYNNNHTLTHEDLRNVISQRGW